MFFFPHDFELTYFLSRFGFLHFFLCPRFARPACVWHDGPCKAKRRSIFEASKRNFEGIVFFECQILIEHLNMHISMQCIIYIHILYIYRYKSISRICIVHCVTLKLHCDAYIYIVYVKLYSISLYHITLHACTCSIAAIFQHHPSCLLRCDRCLQALMAKLWPRRRVPICLLVAGVHF